MTMTQTTLPSGLPAGFSHLESPLPGPVIPAALRRQARALRTVSRHEAARLIIKRGAPFLHAASERYVSLTDAIEALGIEPAAVAATYWHTAGNRLAARQPLPDYTSERHAAHLVRGALR